VLIAGGGTGGHAIPALCVASSLQSMGAQVHFVGSRSGIEATLVPKANFPLHPLNLTAFAGNPIARARAAALFLSAIASCRRIIRRVRPGAVLGVGGYASAPAVVAARTLGVPTLLHEQNSVPGRVNRAAGRVVRETLVTFPRATEYFGEAERVGMPTRTEFFGASRQEALAGLGLEPPVVVIFGGSGGALKLNLATVEAFRDGTPYTVVQVAGRRDFGRLSTPNPRHRILEYVDEIWRYLAAADVVVSRAGAGSLFDIAAVGRAAVLVPFPFAHGDHQLHNARYFTEEGAGELMMDEEVTARSLRRRVEDLLEDDDRREALASGMAALATPGAADAVARRVLRTAGEEAGR
jgi:UDP-N-acetylglucosamine--N-acetylmuramyl-(pentapeptide) pyrophosphoryl-undecaprenol N-acetylglucosamine transferase